MIKYIKQKIVKKNFEKQISYKSNNAYFGYLYKNIDGYACAQSKNIIYGDIDFYTFAAALSLIKPTSKDSFLDLGSGVGKACMTATLTFDIHQSTGIEIEPDLHQLALQAYNKANKSLQNKLNFILDDYCQHSLTDPTIIFINATALFGPLWQKLSEQLNQQVRAGCRVLITSKKLDAAHFNFLGQHPIQMDYGQSHLNFYEKC